MAEQEQNRSEAATPFKLRRAREKGQVARGMDLGFLGALVALAAFLMLAGDALGARLARLMRRTLAEGFQDTGDPQRIGKLLASVWGDAIEPVLLLCGTVTLIILLLQLAQLRGFIFTANPLKPDFSRINPAKGFKQLFSLRMLKEAAKNLLKFAGYSAATALVLSWVLEAPGRIDGNAADLARAMRDNFMSLLFLFILVAALFAVIDQLIVRREFAKQMRMSRRELTRENREREGEPRLKQKRKQLHAEFVKQSRQLGQVSGSDLLVVNPQHIAVALVYDARRMAAPTVTAKAQDHYARAMKQEAFRLGIPMFEDPPLARALYAQCDKGAEIGADQYGPVAQLYLRLRAKASGRKAELQK